MQLENALTRSYSKFKISIYKAYIKKEQAEMFHDRNFILIIIDSSLCKTIV